MAKKIFTLSIGEELEDISVEQLLKREFHLSKREISRAKFQENGICLNGEKVRVNQKVKKGDCLTVSFEEEKTSISCFRQREAFAYCMRMKICLLSINRL